MPKIIEILVFIPFFSFRMSLASICLTLPILSGALLMVLADLHSNTLFFQDSVGLGTITKDLYDSAPVTSSY